MSDYVTFERVHLEFFWLNAFTEVSENVARRGARSFELEKRKLKVAEVKTRKQSLLSKVKLLKNSNPFCTRKI